MNIHAILIACVMAVFITAVMIFDNALALSMRSENKERCESKGGVYTTPRDVGPLCIKKEYYIEL